MATDQLGRIATLHQVLADMENEGTLSSICLKLSDLHSTAVDYSKTGIPVCYIIEFLSSTTKLKLLGQSFPAATGKIPTGFHGARSTCCCWFQRRHNA